MAETASEKFNEPSPDSGSAISVKASDPSKSSDAQETNSLEKALQPNESAKPPRNVSGLSWWLVVLSILSSTFLYALDNTIVANVQPQILKQFDSLSELSWLAVAFLLGAATTNLFWGQCYSQFDAKYTYIICVVIFEIGSAVCGAAPNMAALIVGRAICGLGGAGMYTGVMTLLSVTTLEHERPTYFGLTGITWGAGTVLGPIIGGAFTDSQATWRWAFYINLCVGALFAPVYVFLLPRADPRPGVSLKERTVKIDFIGTILICGTFTAGIMAMSFGGTLFAWNSGRIIGLFVTSGVLCCIFILQQILAIGTTPEHRLFPIQFLRSKTMVIVFFTTACATTTVFVPVYFIPLYFQFVRHDSALQAGVRLLPYVVFMSVTCVLNGYIMSWKGYYMPWFTASGILTLTGSALMYTVNESTSTAKIYGYGILLGTGAGGFIQLPFSVAQAKVKPHLIPIAVSFCTFSQLAGPAVALCIADSVFLNEATNGVVRFLPALSRGTIQAAISGVESPEIQSLSAEMRDTVIQIVVKAMSKTYIVPLTAGALTLVLSLFMKRENIYAKPAAAAA